MSCGERIHNFWAVPGVLTVCSRPEGHEGTCWPVPMAGDDASEEGE